MPPLSTDPTASKPGQLMQLDNNRSSGKCPGEEAVAAADSSSSSTPQSFNAKVTPNVLQSAHAF
jgi:hypothetical protein